MRPLLEIRDLSVRFGSVEAVRDVSIDVEAGSVIGLIGPNGAGKTTLLDVVTGLGPMSSGHVVFAGEAVDTLAAHDRARRGMARTFQSLELFEDLTVEENLSVAAEAGLPLLAARAGRPGRADVTSRVHRSAALTGLTDVLDRVPPELSHGLRKRLALGRALAGSPSLLLLDEPGGGLDAGERAALAGTLRTVAAEGTAVVLVDHDMALVLDVCAEVCVLHQGRLVTQGTPGEVRADPKVAAAYLGTKGAPASPVPVTGPSPADKPVVRVAHLSTGYAGVPVLHDLSLDLHAGEVVALLGANGAGKTTTLSALSGMLPARQGRVEVLGQAVRGRPHEVARRGLAHAPQDRGVLPALTADENLRLASRFNPEGVDLALRSLPGLVPLMSRRAGDLSGGEQQLLAVGRALASRPRVLLLDELSLGLSSSTLGNVLATVRALADAGTGVLLVEQYPDVAFAIADRAYVLQRGRVVLEGPAREVAAQKDALEAAYLG